MIYQTISRSTKALIARASLKLDLQLDRVHHSLDNFLEDELPALTSFGSGTQALLDSFRSFFHQYHVQKFGSWPPPEGNQLPSTLYESMYFDFLGLYEYLVDHDSVDSMRSVRATDESSVPVLENVNNFNKRHGYLPLSHPLPLLPDAISYGGKTHRRRLSNVFSRNSSKVSRVGWDEIARTSLCTAANTRNAHLLEGSLFKDYQVYEQVNALLQEGISLQHMRKVHWILIYSVLQVLTSVTCAPVEVPDTDDANCPLCVTVPEMLPWQEESYASSVPSISNYPASIDQPVTGHHPSISSCSNHTSNKSLLNGDVSLPPTASDFEIHENHDPDATYSKTSRSSSSPVKYAETIISTATQRQTVSKARRDSVISPTLRSGSNSFDSQRYSVSGKASRSSFCEIIVHGYGNGLNMTYDDMEFITQPDYIPKLPPSPDFSSESVIIKARRSSSSRDSFSSYSVSDYCTSDYSVSGCSDSEYPIPVEPQV
jgi:hypothetical protein